MAEFIKINRDLPRKIVTQGVEINFKYTGQPLTCYRCNSTEHVVRNCDKQRSTRPTVTQCLEVSGGEAIPSSPIPTTAKEENTTDKMDHDTEETNMEPSVTASELRASLRPEPRSFTFPCFAWPLQHLLNQENGPRRHRWNQTILNPNNNMLLLNR